MKVNLNHTDTCYKNKTKIEHADYGLIVPVCCGTYFNAEEEITKEIPEDEQPRDEKGRFTKKRTGYSPIIGDVDLEDEGLLPY